MGYYELTQEQYEEIKPSLPGQRGKVKLSNRKVRDRASEGDTTRQPALDLIFSAVVPAKSNRLDPWESDQEHDKKRNEVEGLFSRLKGFGRTFSGLDQLDRMFSAFGFLVLIVDSLRSC